MSKYEFFSGPYFPAFGLNTGKYGPEKTPYLETFHAVSIFEVDFHSGSIVVLTNKKNTTFLSLPQV